MCSCTAMRKGIKMTPQEFDKWMTEMDSKPETRHKLDLVSPMIANIGVEAQNKIKSMGAMLDIDPDGLLMWYAEMMLRARKLGIKKIEKGDTEEENEKE